jgi:NAD(P)H-hydrate epimerase
MRPTLTREQARELDRRAIQDLGIPGMVLMENAGRGVADWLLELGVRGLVAICCGAGNNGGDGLVIARHLDRRGLRVKTLLFSEPSRLQGDALLNFRIVQRAGLPVTVSPSTSELHAILGQAEWVVDALLGTGLTGPARGLVAAAIEAINGVGARVMAVDLPSGLDCDTGEPLGATVRATHTATMVAWKTGFLAPGAWAWTGEIKVVDIGVPRSLLAEFGVDTPD